MRYGLLVIGPAGSGKSTFCHALQQHMEILRRSCSLVNLDPAAEFFLYKPFIDVRELITVDEAATELGLGPNGALVYSMEFLQQHLDWLEEQLLQSAEDTFFVFDCPGQIELYTHLPLMKNICGSLQRAGLRLAACCCLDISFMTDAAKLFGGSLMALSAMVQLELPHINLLTKCDLVARHLAATNISSSSSEGGDSRRVECRHTHCSRDRSKVGRRRHPVHTRPQFHSSDRPRNTALRSNVRSSSNRDSTGSGGTGGDGTGRHLLREGTGEGESLGGKTLQQEEAQLMSERRDQQQRIQGAEGKKEEAMEEEQQRRPQQKNQLQGRETQKQRRQWPADAAAEPRRSKGETALAERASEEEDEAEEEDEHEEEEDEEEVGDDEEEEDEVEAEETVGGGRRRSRTVRAGRAASRGIGFGMLNNSLGGLWKDGNKEVAADSSAATPEELAKERAVDALLSRDPQQLLQQLDDCTPAAYRSLNAAFAALLEDYNLVSFLPCDITEEDSLSAVALALEQTLQYGEDLEVREADILPAD